MTATVMSITAHPENLPADSPPPRVGQSTTIRIEDGILTDPLTGVTYCDVAMDFAGDCGL
jgi:hypothetical protein